MPFSHRGIWDGALPLSEPRCPSSGTLGVWACASIAGGARRHCLRKEGAPHLGEDPSRVALLWKSLIRHCEMPQRSQERPRLPPGPGQRGSRRLRLKLLMGWDGSPMEVLPAAPVPRAVLPATPLPPASGPPGSDALVTSGQRGGWRQSTDRRSPQRVPHTTLPQDPKTPAVHLGSRRQSLSHGWGADWSRRGADGDFPRTSPQKLPPWAPQQATGGWRCSWGQ